MNQPELNDPLDALLREANQYIEDNGFSGRVMTALPQRQRRASWRRILLLGATAVGYLLAIRWSLWNLVDWRALLSLNFHALLTYAVLLAILGSLVLGLISSLGWED